MESLPTHTIGHWIFTTRERFEKDLIEELGKKYPARQVSAGLVLAKACPITPPTFARQGFCIQDDIFSSDKHKVVQQVSRSLVECYERLAKGRRVPFTLQVFVADTEKANPLSKIAQRMQTSIEKTWPTSFAQQGISNALRVKEKGGVLLQVCLLTPTRVLVGAVFCYDALSLFSGGRARVKMPKSSPSRAARKLEEAFLWIGHAPEAGELCVDMGAAPGGWSAVLLSRNAKVIAVDPARLAPDIMAQRKLLHLQQSAFEYTPRDRASWLFCDMAWRPVEAAQLLAKWGRRRWARFLLANLKLPMKKRVQFVSTLREIVASGGWSHIQTRHLYHDRHEITLGARRK